MQLNPQAGYVNSKPWVFWVLGIVIALSLFFNFPFPLGRHTGLQLSGGCNSLLTNHALERYLWREIDTNVMHQVGITNRNAAEGTVDPYRQLDLGREFLFTRPVIGRVTEVSRKDVNMIDRDGVYVSIETAVCNVQLSFVSAHPHFPEHKGQTMQSSTIQVILTSLTFLLANPRKGNYIPPHGAWDAREMLWGVTVSDLTQHFRWMTLVTDQSNLLLFKQMGRTNRPHSLYDRVLPTDNVYRMHLIGNSMDPDLRRRSIETDPIEVRESLNATGELMRRLYFEREAD